MSDPTFRAYLMSLDLRARRALAWLGVTSWADLARQTPWTLLDPPGCGVQTARQILRAARRVRSPLPRGWAAGLLRELAGLP